jgi:hypothetical protein
MTAYCRRKVCALPEEAKAETVHPGFSQNFNKMITIDTKEWRDKLYGNTYFSSEVYLNMDLILVLPFQYGYGGARDAVERKLSKHFGVSAERWELRDMLRKNGIEISETKTKSLKRELTKESFENLQPFYDPQNLALYAAHRFRNNIPVTDGKTAKFIGRCHVVFNDGSDVLFSDVKWF